MHRQIHRPHFSRRLRTIFNKNSHTEIFKEVLIHPERLLGLQVQRWLGCRQIVGCREEGVTEGGCDWTPGSYPGSSGSSRQQQLSFLAQLSSRQPAAQLPQSRHILTLNAGFYKGFFSKRLNRAGETVSFHLYVFHHLESKRVESRHRTARMELMGVQLSERLESAGMLLSGPISSTCFL